MGKIYILCILILLSTISFPQIGNYSFNINNTELIFNGIDTVKTPKNEIYIVPPKYFTYDSTINGFKHNPSHTTIQTTEIKNVDFHKYDKKMTVEYFASQGYKFIERREITTNAGNKAIMYFLEFSTKEDNYERIMFFTGKNNMIWINVNYPQKIKKLIYPSIEKCLKTVR